MIAPRFGFFSRDNKFAVEKRASAPTSDVENCRRRSSPGRDPQLERRGGRGDAGCSKERPPSG
jgi:tricorn protease